MGQGAGPSSVGNTLAAIADGSMAPFFFVCVSFRVCVCIHWLAQLTQNRRGLRKDDDSSSLRDENVGTRKATERPTVGIRER